MIAVVVDVEERELDGVHGQLDGRDVIGRKGDRCIEVGADASVNEEDRADLRGTIRVVVGRIDEVPIRIAVGIVEMVYKGFLESQDVPVRRVGTVEEV